MDDLPNNIPYNYTYTLEYVCLDDVDVYTIHKTILERLGEQTHIKYDKHRLSIIESTTRTKKCECRKMNISGVANFHVELSCARDAIKV